MSNKYIIKNCPALYQIQGMTNECLASDYQCKDCTDCLLKRLYIQIKEVSTLDDINCKISPETMQLSRDVLNVLNLLDIEECE
jgi:hypothetical protein